MNSSGAHKGKTKNSQISYSAAAVDLILTIVVSVLLLLLDIPSYIAWIVVGALVLGFVIHAWLGRLRLRQ